MIQNTNTRFVIEKIIKNALYEDLGQNGDITSNSIIDPEVKNNFSYSNKIFKVKNSFKGKIGVFDIKDNKINHRLNFYKIENKKLIEIF